MTTAQLWTILLTGLLAVLASGVGQYVAGSMAERRARDEREREDRYRYTEVKRELFVRALRRANASQEDEGDPSLYAELSLFDGNVARKLNEVTAARDSMRLNMSPTADYSERSFYLDRIGKAQQALAQAMRESLGVPEPLPYDGGVIVLNPDGSMELIRESELAKRNISPELAASLNAKGFLTTRERATPRGVAARLLAWLRRRGRGG